MTTRCLVPACYFPSTVYLIDDSRNFLESFALALDDSFTPRLFDSPKDALKALQASHVSDVLSQHLSVSEGKSLHEPLVPLVNIDLSAIHWEVYNPHRFNEVAVVVVDFSMPGMNGLEFCHHIRQMPVKKILLTGIADEKIALEAFNDGLIDAYYQKHDLNILRHVSEAVQKLQSAYFQNMSQLLIELISPNDSCLQDPKFSEFFFQLCHDLHIAEYYLMESSGSFLLLDANAQPTGLIIKSKEDLLQCSKIAIQNNAPKTVIEQLATGTAVPYFWQAYGINQDQWSEWSTYLHPAKEFAGTDTTYYYALVKDARSFDVQKDKILSYNEYRADHESFESEAV